MGFLGLLLMWIAVVGVHDLAHVAAARPLHVPVERVSFGWGPRLRRGQLRTRVVELRLLPVGFVAFGAAPPARRVLVRLAGIGANAAFAVLVLLAGLSASSVPVRSGVEVPVSAGTGSRAVEVSEAFAALPSAMVHSLPYVRWENTAVLVGAVPAGTDLPTTEPWWVTLARTSWLLAIVNLVVPFRPFDLGHMIWGPKRAVGADDDADRPETTVTS